MPKVNGELFVNDGRTDYDSVLFLDEEFLKYELKIMFDNNLLDHPFTKLEDSKNTFENYWNKYKYNWRKCDLNKDDRFELFFNGITNWSDSTESFQIYELKDIDYELVYNHIGNLIAYKIQPFTKEIILFHHKYPCCDNASHYINSVRFLKSKIHLRQKYFVAREGDMKGNFFPEAVFYEDLYSLTKKNTRVYWSDKKIWRAWKRSGSNQITKYKEDMPYKVLAVKDGMKYVLISGQPIIEANKVINPANFESVKIFGWIKD